MKRRRPFPFICSRLFKLPNNEPTFFPPPPPFVGSLFIFLASVTELLEVSSDISPPLWRSLLSVRRCPPLFFSARYWPFTSAILHSPFGSPVPSTTICGPGFGTGRLFCLSPWSRDSPDSLIAAVQVGVVVPNQLRTFPAARPSSSEFPLLTFFFFFSDLTPLVLGPGHRRTS